MAIKLLGIGHSHLNPMNFGMSQIRLNRPELVAGVQMAFVSLLREERFLPNFEATNAADGLFRLSDTCKTALEATVRAEAPDVILTALSGQESIVLSISPHPIPFDFLTPDTPDLSDGGEFLIPHAVIRAEMKRLVHNGVTLFQQFIRTVTDAPIIQFAPPPPIEDEAYIRQNPAALAERFAQYGINPAPFRYKMWKLYADVLAEAGKAMNIETLMPPQATLENGYLAGPYRATEPVHGNPAYGTKQMEIVLELVRQRAQKAA